MKTLIKITIIASILCCIGSVFALDYVAYERTQPITIDGIIDAGEWDQAVHHVMKYPDIVNAPYNGSVPVEPTHVGFFAPVDDADLSGEIYATWDKDYFYFAARVYDDSTSFNATGNNDGVQLLFNPSLGTGDYRLQGRGSTIFDIAPDGNGGTIVTSRVSGFNDPNSVIEAASTVLSDGYVIEFKYAWSNTEKYAANQPQFGDIVRVSWVLADDVQTASKTLICDSSGPNHSWALHTIETWNNFVMVSASGCGLNGIMAGDLDRDCYVGLDDLAIIVDQWLDCSDPQTPGCVQM